MPRLSDSMEEGTILKWLVSEGDEVEKGQEIAEIETDKANMTYESDTGGTIIELVADEDEDDEEPKAEQEEDGSEDEESDEEDEDEEPKAEEEDEDSDEEEESGD